MSKRNSVHMQYVEAHDHAPPFVLLKPSHCPVRDIFWEVNTYQAHHEIDELILQLQASSVVAIDYETTGLDVYHRDFRAIGVGFAWDKARCYLSNVNEESWIYLHRRLAELPKNLIAHNVMFDGAVFYKYAGVHAPWLACTYGLYKQLATEGWVGQKWGLKDAQLDVLLWESSNDVELDKWLIDNNYTKQSDKRIIADKSYIHAAPTDLVAKYCLLDCESTYLLYTQHLRPCGEQFPDLLRFHETAFIEKLVPTLVEQYLRGIQVVPELLNEHMNNLDTQMAEVKLAFRKHPDVIMYVKKLEAQWFAEFMLTEPRKHKKLKEVGAEPPRKTKKGKPNPRWDSWKQKAKAEPAVSKNWLKWEQKKQAIIRDENPDYLVNLGSGDQMRQILFLSGLVPYREGQPHKLDDLGRVGTQGTIWVTRPDGSEVELDLTESGLLPLGEITYKQLGEIGELLLTYNELKTERGYLQTYIEGIYIMDDGVPTLHPNFRVPGPVTGRLSSNGPNLQQLKKKQEVLQCFVPRDGFILVDSDLSSIEGVVMAYLSGDTALSKLYGPNAPKVQDLHLFNGAAIPGLREPILAAGYDPDNPTEENISRAKKEAKSARAAAKTAGYALVYGAGANRIWRTLNLDGIPTSLEQAEKIHAGYWDLYGGIKRYTKELQEEWRLNSGYIMSPFGLPQGICEDLKKDVVNRITQFSAHFIHTIWMDIFTDMLNEEGIEWYPFIIDWHDQSIVEVRPKDAERVRQIMQTDSFVALNDFLQWSVEIKGEAQIVNDLAEAKL